MKYELATKIMQALQQMFIEQKRHTNLFFRGEETVLIYLNKKTDQVVTPSEISKNLKITTARVAASLNGLEAKGLITRQIDSKDRRKINIKLTKTGTKRAIDLEVNHLAKVNSILNKLGSKDASNLIRIIEKLTTVLKEEKELC